MGKVKVNFKQLMVEIEFGHLEPMDVCKPLGNCIHRGTPDIAVDDLAKDIYYSKGEIEIPSEMVEHIKDIVGKSNLLAFVKKAVLLELEPKPNKIVKIKEDQK